MLLLDRSDLKGYSNALRKELTASKVTPQNAYPFLRSPHSVHLPAGASSFIKKLRASAKFKKIHPKK